MVTSDTDDEGANDGKHSAGPHTCKQGRTGQGCEASFGSNLGCSDCKTVEFRILRGQSKAKSGSQP